MDTIALVLILLLAVVLSSALSQMLRGRIPLALLQIALGAALASVTQVDLELDPELFFLLFLPPLLFLDGWRSSKASLLRDGWLVLALALGLVVFTVLGLGYFLHAMIRSMPLPIAFALAAIVSPTDPIALTSIAQRVPVPRRLLHILENESLLNDASGLVCMRFAVLAATTGAFSLKHASLTFLWLAAGGIGIGAVFTALVMKIRVHFNARYGEESGSQILLSLLIPFGAYMLAEEAHASGILAVVAAGITMALAESGGRALPITRVRRMVVWDAIQYAANGVIFLLLGAQLPGIHSSAAAVIESGNKGMGWLFLWAAGITAALIALRFLWCAFSLKLLLFRGSGVRGPSLRLTTTAALAGARGAVTLAAVFTLPLTMPDGSPFPDRELAIILAASVILLSLIAANLLLPSLLRGVKLPPEPSHEEEERQARVAAAEAALQAIAKAVGACPESETARYTEAASKLIDEYRARVANGALDGEAAEQHKQLDGLERTLRRLALQAERSELLRRARRRQLEDDAATHLVRELDIEEARLSAVPEY